MMNEFIKSVAQVLITIPNIDTENGRRAFIYSTTLGQELEKHIIFEGAAHTFCHLLISTLIKYGALSDGRDALETVLETAIDSVGEEKKRQCTVLIRRWHAYREKVIGLGIVKETGIPEEDSLKSEYMYDVFLSYRDSFIGTWVDEYFLPVFKWQFEACLGRDPEIFLGKQIASTGGPWPLRRRIALAHSRCLIGVWAPKDFESLWSKFECAAVLYRESQMPTSSASKLILPVVVSDGIHFPRFTLDRFRLDCTRFAIPAPAFKKSERYIEFLDKIKEWIMEHVEEVIQQAPPWRQEWLDDPPIAMPETPRVRVTLPTLGEE